MRATKNVALLIPLFLLTGCSSSPPSTVCTTTTITSHCPFGQPVSDEDPVIVIRRGQYEIGYSPVMRTPLWVCETVSPSELTGSAKRYHFRLDPLVARKYQASSGDYRNSGFHRGHLAAAANQKWNQQAMNDTFYLTNVAPQYPEFNTGTWYRFEKRIRELAVRVSTTIHVITGPAFNTGFNNLKKVQVPDYYWKVLVVKRTAAAFLVRHDRTAQQLTHVTVDWIENLTGFDFMPLLSVRDEKRLEKKLGEEPIFLWLLEE